MNNLIYNIAMPRLESAVVSGGSELSRSAPVHI
jgi:hypothetical protein